MNGDGQALCREERETIIGWSEGDQMATVYTSINALKNRMEKAGFREINRGDIWREYEVSVECISIRKPRAKKVLTEEQLVKARERMRLMRAAKQEAKKQSV